MIHRQIPLLLTVIINLKVSHDLLRNRIPKAWLELPDHFHIIVVLVVLIFFWKEKVLLLILNSIHYVNTKV